jgi:hypothetical protein
MRPFLTYGALSKVLGTVPVVGRRLLPRGRQPVAALTSRGRLTEIRLGGARSRRRRRRRAGTPGVQQSARCGRHLRPVAPVVMAIVAVVAGDGALKLVNLVSHSYGFVNIGAGVVVLGLDDLLMISGASQNLPPCGSSAPMQVPHRSGRARGHPSASGFGHRQVVWCKPLRQALGLASCRG